MAKPKRPRPRAEIVRSPAAVAPTEARMFEIIELITPTASNVALVEYSALLCIAVQIIAATSGVSPTRENLSAVFGEFIETIVPSIEELINELEKRGAKP